MTIGQVISRVRNLIKATDIDDFVTDRFLWSLITKHASFVITRNAGSLSVADTQELYTELSPVVMEKVSKVSECSLLSGLLDFCDELTLMKSTEPLPSIRTVGGKFLINVYSPDKSVKFQQTSFARFSNLVRSRYSKLHREVYYILDAERYLYIVNDEIDEVTVEASFIDSFDSYHLLVKKCDDGKVLSAQDLPSGLPQSMISEIEGLVLQDLHNGLRIQDQADLGHDNRSVHA